MSDENILSSAQGFHYFEEAPEIDAGEFQKVIDSRRSVRIYTDEKIPGDILHRCMENALLAPNSSNLQPWEIYCIQDPEKRRAINYACLSQVAAKSAAALFVMVARIDTWRHHAGEMIELFNRQEEKIPKAAFSYYKKIVPFVYTQGPFSILGFLKRLLYFFRGLSAPIIREPVSKKDMKLWSSKTTALAAENLMLSLRAYGYDSCPMEGFDSKRIKKILSLPRGAFVVMVVSAGKRARGGIYGKRIRYDSKRFIKMI